MSEIKQNTPEWLEMRKQMIGASDAPIILGISPYKTPYRLWQEKLNLIAPEEASYIQQKGHKIEPEARAKVESLTGLLLSPQVLFHKNVKWMMASLDGVDVEGKQIVEIKMANKDDHAQAEAGIVPEKHMPQLQHQMEVACVPCMLFFSYHNGDGQIVEVKRDEDFTKNILKAEKKFFDCMQNLEPPVLTDRDYSMVESEERSLLAKRWQEIEEALNSLKEEEKSVREALISTCGDRSSIGGGVKITKYLRKGAVDYKNIPVLQGVDLEKYRKAAVDVWKISACL